MKFVNGLPISMEKFVLEQVLEKMSNLFEKTSNMLEKTNNMLKKKSIEEIIILQNMFS